MKFVKYNFIVRAKIITCQILIKQFKIFIIRLLVLCHYAISPSEALRDRIQLAALILNDLTEKNIEVIDSSDSWTEQDKLDITSFSLNHAASLLTDEEEII